MSSNHELLSAFYIYLFQDILQSMTNFYPASGSFFIPLILIVFLYFKIFTTQQKVASRRKQIKTNTSGSQGQGAKQVHSTLWLGLVYEWRVVCLHFSQTALCMHYSLVLSQESENKQMRIEMVMSATIIPDTNRWCQLQKIISINFLIS